MTDRESSIVLVSGGMDSLVTAAEALCVGDPAFLHVSYGQRTARKEQTAFRAIADHYNVKKRLECSISYLRDIGGSSLIDRSLPVRVDGVDQTEIPDSYVPFRNAHLLSIAVSWAEVIGASAIYIGAVEEDSSGYPDCTASFFDAFQRTARLGTAHGGKIRVVTPVIHLSKTEIVARGVRLGAPLHLSWSCYQEEDRACGVCDSCRLRIKAFEENHLTDPILYAN